MTVGLPYDAEVEYLESTGTQYIDTGVYASATLPFDCIFSNGTTTSPGYGNVFGSRNYENTSNAGEYQLSNYTGGLVSIGYRNQRLGFGTNAINHVQFNGGTSVVVNGVDKTIVTLDDMTGNVPIYLFGLSKENIYGRAAPMQLQPGRIYACRFGNVRDYIPVRVGNVGYMYDRVTRKLFGNQGTGDGFGVGADVSKPVMALHTYEPPYWGLTFTAEEANSTIAMMKWGNPPAVSLEVSIDNGRTWTPFIVGETIITLANIGDSVCFRAGDGGTGGDGVNLAMARKTSNTSPSNTFRLTGRIAASGDISSILDRRGTVSALGVHAFCHLFEGCASLTAAPALPATTLAEYCYSNMFSGCSGLMSAPALPVTTLAYYCCRGMFSGCSSLTIAPALPATNLKVSCYESMFSGCTSLTIAPALPATTLASHCYGRMFYNCTALAAAPELPATTLAQSCYNYMFNGCTALTAAPELPVTALAAGCYFGMFFGCTSLTNAPALPATTLANDCYGQMFASCTALTAAPALPATTLVARCYAYMFHSCTSLREIEVAFSAWASDRDEATVRWLYRVSATGTFRCPSTLPHSESDFGDSKIPTGWTVQTFDPAEEGGAS